MIKKSLTELFRAVNYKLKHRRPLKLCSVVPTEYHGSEYGGWAIAQDSLSNSSIVYSFGVGEDITFDEALIRKYDCYIYAFDPTPKVARWLKSRALNPKFLFYPWALTATSGDVTLYEPKNLDHVSASIHKSEISGANTFQARGYCLETIMSNLQHRRIDLLKIDIEGEEYAVIHSICENGIVARIDQFLIEFHHWKEVFSEQQTRYAADILKKRGFQIQWVSRRGHEVLFRRVKKTII
jgi:FkbM family methyltransferase